MQKILISALLLILSGYASAQEINFKNISFKLNDTWASNESNDSLVLKTRNGRYFIASVFYPPSSFDSLNMSIKAEETLSALTTTKAITIHKDFDYYSSKSGVPFREIQFTSENPKGFVLGGTINSNYAFILFTYEGPGTVEEGANDVQDIFNGLSIKKR